MDDLLLLRVEGRPGDLKPQQIYLAASETTLVGRVVTYFGRRMFEPAGGQWFSKEMLSEISHILAADS